MAKSILPPETPIRYCHGCGNFGPGPRYNDVSDIHNPAADKLYHYDCIPADLLVNPEIAESVRVAHEAIKQGIKDNELSQHIGAYAATIAEAPADEEL